MKTNLQHLLIALALLATLPRAAAQAVDDASTASYQGLLSRQTNDLTSSYDMTFTLFNTNSGGSPVAGPITNTAVAVNSNGLFSTTMNFGSNSAIIWDIPLQYSLEVAVRPSGGGAFTTLTPRQPITSAPRSIYALNAGTATIATSATNFSGVVAGDVSGPQGATVVTSVGGQTAASVANGVMIANAATAVDDASTAVMRDATGSFAAGSVTLNGALYLPSPAMIYSGSNTMLIEDGSFYAGSGAGNADPLTTDLHNVGVGDRALHSDNAGKYNTGIGESNLFFNTTGSFNTAGGFDSLYHNTTGSNNKADGYQALFSNTTGSNNTANGYQALYNNVSGSFNDAFGYQALQSATTVSLNSAFGAWALQANTGGYQNAAFGFGALYSNISGFENSASGVEALWFNTAGSYNTAQGFQALYYNTASYNTADGFQALVFNTTGAQNTAVGYESLFNNTVGVNNTADGFQALYSNTSGTNLTAFGFQALYNNSSGYANVANGFQALYNNTSGFRNTAIGYLALTANTSGAHNTASGLGALSANTTGNFNTAAGDAALGSNTTGSDNTANGVQALGSNTNGNFNTADGQGALLHNTAGSNNTASGYSALFNLGHNGGSPGNNTADGYGALAQVPSGSNNIAVGYLAGNSFVGSESGNIDIGNTGVAGENNTIRIGTLNNVSSNGPANTYISGIYDNYSFDGTQVAVQVDSTGHLGIPGSSERFKQNIQTMADASDVLLALRPVKYQYKPGLDPKGIPQFGLIAEEVEKIDPDLVVHDDRHGIYTVRYEAVNAMLLNEFLKQHQKMEEQNTEIESLKEKAAKVEWLESRLDELQALVKQLAAQK